MEKSHEHEFERDDVVTAVRRERELRDALFYLDRAISNLANQESDSRWLNSYKAPERPVFSIRPLAFIVERCVSAFRPEQRSHRSVNALPFH